MYVTWKCTFAWFWVRPVVFFWRPVVFFGAQRRSMLNLYIRSFPDAPGKLPDAPRKLPDAPANVQKSENSPGTLYIYTYNTCRQAYMHACMHT